MLPARDIRVTAFGNRVQEAGAGVVSLGGLYADPIGAMRRVQSRARKRPLSGLAPKRYSSRAVLEVSLVRLEDRESGTHLDDPWCQSGDGAGVDMSVCA